MYHIHTHWYVHYTGAHITDQTLTHVQFTHILSQPSPTHSYIGMGYLELAAKAGVREAMLQVASAYDTGIGLGNSPDSSRER